MHNEQLDKHAFRQWSKNVWQRYMQTPSHFAEATRSGQLHMRSHRSETVRM
jgi:ABC-type bacteriocin/lantibiotic exporter with double-glycine peptidase domain